MAGARAAISSARITALSEFGLTAIVSASGRDTVLTPGFLTGVANAIAAVLRVLTGAPLALFMRATGMSTLTAVVIVPFGIRADIKAVDARETAVTAVEAPILFTWFADVVSTYRAWHFRASALGLTFAAV